MVGTVASSKIHRVGGVSQSSAREMDADVAPSVNISIGEAFLQDMTEPWLASSIAIDEYIGHSRESIREQGVQWEASNASNSAQIARARETIRRRQAWRARSPNGTDQPPEGTITTDQSAQRQAPEPEAASIDASSNGHSSVEKESSEGSWKTSVPLPTRPPPTTTIAPHLTSPTPEMAVVTEVSNQDLSDNREQLQRTRPNDSLEKLLVDEVRVIVGPFTKFQIVHEFRNVLSSVAGIRHIRVRRLYQGRLHLVVTYESSVPLADQLQHIEGWPSRVTVSDTDLVEVELLDSSG